MNKIREKLEKIKIDKKIKQILSWGSKNLELTLKEQFLDDLIVQQGQVWLCDLGENTGSELNNKRPVIILQRNCIDAKTVLIAPISNKPTRCASHVKIENDLYKNMVLSGTITVEHVREVSIARLCYKLGDMTEKGMDKVLIALIKTTFGIKRTSNVLNKLDNKDIEILDKTY